MPVKNSIRFALASLLGFFLVAPMTGNAQERIELADGSVLSVFLVEPENTNSEASPLLVLMGGGPGNASISRDTSQWLGSGFAARGWYVAVPISPNNRSFRGDEGNEKIEHLITALKLRSGVRPGKVLLAGVSNGGMSALEIAARSPKDYFGVAAIPALFDEVKTDKVFEGFKIYLRIGGEDQLGWAQRYTDTVSNLNEAGAHLDADILDGAPHMFRMDWSTLAPWLEVLD